MGIDRLGVEERLDLIGLIWDSIQQEAHQPPVLPHWHRRELEQRCAAADAAPDAGIPWEVVKARLDSAT